MNKLGKGCLVTFSVLAGLVVIGFVVLYFYWTSPNKIEFSGNPIKQNKYLNNISFDNQTVPKLILNQPEKNIIYQAYIKDDGMDMTVIYKAAFKMKENIELGNPLPLNQSEIETLNNNIAYQQIENGFKPKLKIPDDNKTPSGRHLTIYSTNDDILMTLKSGSYSYFHNEIDKDGSISELIIFDKESKILYYERQRYFAFQ